MAWHTNPVAIWLRNLARRMGLTFLLNKLMPDRGYEASFDNELFSNIKVGDTLWDVGANVGYYTRKFSDAVGPQGHVVAFEPFPSSAEKLRAATAEFGNVQLIPVALGSSDGAIQMEVGGDALGATNRIVETGGEAGLGIEMLTGDQVVERGMARAPTMVKIDTEGFELDVLKGMTAVLKDKALIAVFIEVHFGLLAERGMPKAPAEIEALLKRTGFNTRWVDASHIAGFRPASST